MAANPVAARYAEALAETALREKRLDETAAELARLARLMREEPGLASLLADPGVPAGEKSALLERVFGGAWPELVRAFVRMLIELGRVEALPEIADALGEFADRAKGLVRVVVRSAHPVSGRTLERLRALLSREQGGQVELSTEPAPELIGGLQIVLGHRVIDGSVRRRIDDLREQLSAVRVH
ncbi:MAG TPA: ATP synthase F1 subunit delta [bacterium]